MIAVSGLGQAINWQSCWRQNIVKPYTAEELLQTLQHSLQQMGFFANVFVSLCYRVVEKLTKIEILILKLVLKLGL